MVFDILAAFVKLFSDVIKQRASIKNGEQSIDDLIRKLAEVSNSFWSVGRQDEARIEEQLENRQ